MNEESEAWKLANLGVQTMQNLYFSTDEWTEVLDEHECTAIIAG